MERKFKELKEALKKGSFCDFILSNAYRFANDELARIIVEMDWAVHTNEYNGLHYDEASNAFEQDTLQNLEEYGFFDDDEALEEK